MANIVFISPGKYIQGAGALKELGKHIKELGRKPLIIADEVVWGITGDVIKQSLSAEGKEFHFVSFNGEASSNEVNRIAQEGRSQSVDFVIGVGGAKRWTRPRPFPTN